MEAFEAIVSLLLVGLALFAKIGKDKKKAKPSGTTGDWDRMIPSPASPEKPAVPPIKEIAEAKPAAEKQRPADFQSGFVGRPDVMPAAEGNDPCHDGLYAVRDEDQTDRLTGNADASPAARELVRGFVLAEVLAKPKFRQTAGK